MKTTIDTAGRVVIPKALREAVGMSAGEVDIEIDGATIRIAPAATGRLVDKDGWLVIDGEGPPVTAEEIRALRIADQR